MFHEGIILLAVVAVGGLLAAWITGRMNPPPKPDKPMKHHALQCERCEVEKPCAFYGTPADPDSDKPQSNGEWLCDDCVPLRMDELDDVVAKLQAFNKPNPEVERRNREANRQLRKLASTPEGVACLRERGVADEDIELLRR